MIDWQNLIENDGQAVVLFATSSISGKNFEKRFSGNPNPARFAVRNHGVTYARRLARKALRRRGFTV